MSKSFWDIPDYKALMLLPNGVGRNFSSWPDAADRLLGPSVSF
jgi:hypothetical protein